MSMAMFMQLQKIFGNVESETSNTQPYVFSFVSQESPVHCSLMVWKLWMSPVEPLLPAVASAAQPEIISPHLFIHTISVSAG